MAARKPEVAFSLWTARVMREMCNVETVIVRANEHEVYVFTKSQEVIKNIREGRNWSMGHENPDSYGYVQYIYTRLSEKQLVEHLQDPSKFQGSDQ